MSFKDVCPVHLSLSFFLPLSTSLSTSLLPSRSLFPPSFMSLSIYLSKSFCVYLPYYTYSRSLSFLFLYVSYSLFVYLSSVSVSFNPFLSPSSLSLSLSLYSRYDLCISLPPYISLFLLSPLFLYTSLYHSFSIALYLSLSIYLSIYFSIYLSIYLSSFFYHISP